MSESEQDIEIWERGEEEPALWYGRFLIFRDMGYARSLLGSVHVEEAQKSPKKPSVAPPGAWKDAAKQWEWRKRAEVWDAEQERLALAECKYSRISERAKLLDKWIGTQDAIMIASVAEQGYARADSMEQLRGLLDDMAKEMGGRVKVAKANLEHTGKDGGAIYIETVWGSTINTDEE